MNRRELLVGILATPAVAAIPDVAVAASPAPVGLPAWSVGTPGDMNWNVFFCKTQDEAIEAWRSWNSVDNDDDTEWVEARREPKFDNPLNDDPDTILKYQAGWTVFCDRCDYEVSRDDGESEIVNAGKSIVCTDCMTADEWEVRDPERAAEMREEAKA